MHKAVILYGHVLAERWVSQTREAGSAALFVVGYAK